MAHTPLQHLHAPHRGPHDRDDVRDPEVLGQQPVLRGHHVADEEARELHARLLLAVRGRGSQAVADGVGGDDEVLRGIERLAGADEEVQAMVVAADGGDHQHGVGLLRVQRAVRHVRDGEVLDDLAALERELAEPVLLVRRLIGPVRKRRQGRQREAGEAGEPGSTYGGSVQCRSPFGRQGVRFKGGFAIWVHCLLRITVPSDDVPLQPSLLRKSFSRRPPRGNAPGHAGARCPGAHLPSRKCSKGSQLREATYAFQRRLIEKFLARVTLAISTGTDQRAVCLGETAGPDRARLTVVIDSARPGVTLAEL